MTFDHSPAPALLLDNVVKKFKDFTAVDGLSLRVDTATVTALLGPNGAGKTTTIEMCEGFTRPTSGTISVLGLDPYTDTDTVRRRIGIMLQGGGAYPGIRVKEMLKLVASYSANPLDVDWLLDTVGLARHSKTPYRRLSGGQQQRLSLACALVGRPELIFLDEPTAGMDAQSRLAVWDLINCLRNDGVTVLLTTHLMDEAEALADDVVIIDRGRIVAHGTPAELTTRDTGRISVTTGTALDVERLTRFFTTRGLAVACEAVRPLSYRLDMQPTPQVLEVLFAACAEQDTLVTDFSCTHSSLEDVFLDITGTQMRN